MPKLLVDAEVNVNTNHGFSYSHIGVEKLEASNYTIVHIVIDKSGSVYNFKKELEDICKVYVESCQDSPESENLLIRVTAFDNNMGVDIEEIHGYTLFSAIDPNQYDGTINPRGGTPLYDATLDSLESLKDFSEKLYEEQHLCNAILFVITDGEENASNNSLADVTKLMKKVHRDEQLESFTSILIGVNTDDSYIKEYLENYHKDADFDQYVDIDKADKKGLAKLAKFVSQSVSSTSQALGGGNASQLIDYNSLTI